MTEYEQIEQELNASIASIEETTAAARALAVRIIEEIPKHLQAPPRSFAADSPRFDAADNSFKMTVSLKLGPGVLTFPVELRHVNGALWDVTIAGATDRINTRMDQFQGLVSKLTDSIVRTIQGGGPGFIEGTVQRGPFVFRRTS